VTAAILRELERNPKILEVFNVITLAVGPQIMLAAKLRMSPDLRLEEAIGHINELERHLRERVPELGWLFMEPDLRD